MAILSNNTSKTDCPPAPGWRAASASFCTPTSTPWQLDCGGMIRDTPTLAANYLLKRLEAIGCQAAYPERRASHEFILTFAKQAKDNHVTALDIAKRLLDYNQHAPTIYFPLLVPECFLIEPTETETKEAMDDFIDAMAKILEEANTNPETVTEAPFTQPVRRLDEVKAAKELDLVWSEC